MSKGRSIKSAHRLKGFDVPTVWHEFSGLAMASNSINLGQGFPGSYKNYKYYYR